MENIRDFTPRVPEDHLLDDHTHDGGLKDKLHHLRVRSMQRLGSLREDMSGRVTALNSNVRTQVRSNPTKWAGIAAGAGLGLGIIGRLMRNRSQAIPHVVIIDRAC
jgi:ElaB/YqjD/DUF883 family membrane-anchored ribosome-binding protein